jgi:hypothetical protein
MIAIALEEGDLPLIHQCGFAEFEAAANDHRIITTDGAYDERECEKGSWAAARDAGEGTATVGSGQTAGNPATTSTEAAAGTAARRDFGWTLAHSVEEDSRDLSVYFPQFSVVLFDPKLRLWYREGWLQPLEALHVRFPTQLYYDDQDARALPLLVVPDLQPNAPHLWQHTRNGFSFRSLCYTFAPDRTIMRGRSPADTAAEVLRQGVVWLLRYMVWCRFGFWVGADVGHDPAEIARSTKPDDPCPTHSWRPYGACCRPKHLEVIKQRRPLQYGVNPSRALPRPDA